MNIRSHLGLHTGPGKDADAGNIKTGRGHVYVNVKLKQSTVMEYFLFQIGLY